LQEYPSFSRQDEDPKAILGLNIHGGAEPIEVDIENSGPWQAGTTVNGKKDTESITFTLPNTDEIDNEEKSYDSEDEDYTRKNKDEPKFRWYKEGKKGEYFRVDKIKTEIFTDRQIPDEQRPKSTSVVGVDREEDAEEDKGKSGKGGKGGKGRKK